MDFMRRILDVDTFLRKASSSRTLSLEVRGDAVNHTSKLLQSLPPVRLPQDGTSLGFSSEKRKRIFWGKKTPISNSAQVDV